MYIKANFVTMSTDSTTWFSGIFPGVSVTSSPVTGQRGVRLPGGEIFACSETNFLGTRMFKDVDAFMELKTLDVDYFCGCAWFL